MDKMDHNAHSVYLMYYHLIMVVKYRRKVIDDPISERAKEIWERIAPDYGITLEEWNHDVDHVHVMFRAQPKSELGKFINAYKSASSRLLKKEYPQIRERLCAWICVFDSCCNFKCACIKWIDNTWYTCTNQCIRYWIDLNLCSIRYLFYTY